MASALLLSFITTFSNPSHAWTSSACVKGNGSDQLLNKNGKRKYKIHIKSKTTDKIRKPDGTIYTNEEVTAAIHLAAAAWNEQANGGYYVFDGLTTTNTLPSSKSNCNTQSIDYDLVVVGGTSQNSALSVQNYKCTDSNGYHYQNVFTLYNSTNSGFLPWAADEVGANEYDFVHNIAHEFGHGLGLGHPNGVSPALVSVMQVTLTGNSTTSAVGKNRQRELYMWDIECINQISGVRSTNGYVRYTTNINPALSSPTMFSGSWLGHKGSPEYYKKYNHWQFCVFFVSTCWLNSLLEQSNQSHRCCEFSKQHNRVSFTRNDT